MALVADQHDRVAVGREALGLDVHLGHQRAGGVEHLQPALAAVGVHLRGDAVGRQHHHRALGHVLLGVDEHRAAVGQLLDDVPVVHDLLAHVDRRAEVVERPLDRVDGAVDAGAVAAGRGQHEAGRGHAADASSTCRPALG